MASFKSSYPVIAPITAEPASTAPTYGTGMKIGKMISTTLAINTNEASLYGDDALAEYVAEFKDLDITLNITTLPAAAYEMLFGSAEDSTSHAIESTTTDEAKYVGYGFIKGEMVDGVTTYYTVWIPKVKFAPIGEDAETRGDSINWKTPSLSGKGMPGNDGVWRVITPYTTEASAIAALKTKAGIS